MKLNWMNLWTGGSAVVLVGSETFACLYSGAWAISGLLKFGPIADYGLMAIATIASIALTVVFARLAFTSEPLFGDPKHNDEGGPIPESGQGAIASSQVLE